MNQEFTLINIPDNTHYFININGDVYSTKTNKILKPYINRYCKVVLCINNKTKTYSIHRLVGLTFIPNPENKPQINHKNGIKTDNHLDNLEWVTHSQNMKHASVTGLMVGLKGDKSPMFGRTGEKSPAFGKGYLRLGAKNPRSKKVMCVETGEIFDSTYCITRKYGYNRSSVSKVCRGKNKTSYGFTWRYL